VRIEALGDIPRQTFGFHCGLQIAAREIQAHAVSEHAIQRVFCVDVATALRKRHHHLHFMMQLVRRGRVGHGALRDDRVRRLHEEHRVPTAHRLRAHLLGMVRVIAADAVDAVQGKA
jgi:hypothetical protein